MKNSISFLTVSILLLFTFCSKKSDSPQPSSTEVSTSSSSTSSGTYNMSATLIDASTQVSDWKGKSSATTSWDKTIITTSSTNDSSFLQIVLRDSIHIGTYTVRDTLYCFAKFNKHSTAVNYTSQTTVSNFEVTEINNTSRTFSGKFRLSYFKPNGNGLIAYTQQNGVFTNIPFTKGNMMTPAMFVKAKIDGSNFEATSTSLTIPESASTDFVSSDNNGTRLTINVDVYILRLDMNNNTTSNTLYYKATNGTGTSNSNSFKVTYYNKWLKIIGGEFSYSVVFTPYSINFPQSTVNVTNGTFLVRYD